MEGTVLKIKIHKEKTMRTLIVLLSLLSLQSCGNDDLDYSPTLQWDRTVEQMCINGLHYTYYFETNRLIAVWEFRQDGARRQVKCNW